MPALTIQVNHGAGLHARPLAQFVKTVKSFNTTIQVKNLTNGKGPLNGSSPVNLMLLSVLKGHEILIETEGEQAEEALLALKVLIESNFGEG
jgi:phosphotransferase system HPr (HPr) family protein